MHSSNRRISPPTIWGRRRGGAGGRSEDGAIAIIVAAFSIVMFVLAGFAVDFGMAYNSKQELQSAADAASLAALATYKGDTRSCAQQAADSTLLGAATTAANAIAQANRAGTGNGTLTMACNGSNQLTATYLVGGSSRSIVGRITGTGDNIAANRSAQATMKDAPFPAGGLRPWGICAGTVTTTGNVTFVPMKGASVAGAQVTDPCGTTGPPGGWWVASCNNQGNGTGATANTVTNGCSGVNYAPVPNQPAGNSTTLSTFLRNACPSGAETANCIVSDNGNNFHNTSDQWQALIGQTFLMPVICSPPKCTPMAVSGSGANASYAIQRIATVELCGFELQPRGPSTGWPTTGPCATNNPAGYTSGSVTNGGGFFLVIKALSGGDSGEQPWQLPNPVVNLTQ